MQMSHKLSFIDHRLPENILQTLEIISRRKKVSVNFFAIYQFGTLNSKMNAYVA